MEMLMVYYEELQTRMLVKQLKRGNESNPSQALQVKVFTNSVGRSRHVRGGGLSPWFIIFIETVKQIIVPFVGQMTFVSCVVSE